MNQAIPTASQVTEALAQAIYGTPFSEIADPDMAAKYQAAAEEIATKSLHRNVVAIAEFIARAEYDAEFAILNVFEVGYCSFTAREVVALLN
ncbi:hypothetical protein ABZX75_17525 [Streptomyces sp. NPDC003038]|uniref:hypothetical protein n=1 Tax=unclassified Streptomyces TaxID=2593676 RepID=UPI0033AD376D